MSVDSLNNGKRFLEGLIFRTETILGKMVYKLLKTNITLDELVPMINSVLAFVNNWEEKLVDIRQEMLGETDPNKALASSIVSSSSSKSTERKNNEDKKVVPTRPAKLNTPDIRNSKGEFKPKHSESKPIQQFTRDNSSLLEMRHIQEKGPVFEFKEQSLKNYVDGYVGIGMITYVEPKSTTFFLLDRTNKEEKTTKMLESLQNVTSRLEALPTAVETVFGVELNGVIFRAVRSRSGTTGYDFLRLLDTGEVVICEEATAMLYELPLFYKKIPALCVQCCLVDVVDDPSCGDYPHYLANSVYKDKKFEICGKSGSLLYVNLSSCDGKVTPKIKKPVEKKPEPVKEYKISESNLTQEQRDILFEEPMSTSNAMKATMGFVPKDDQRICPFYDPRIDGCFKGASCRLEHVSKDSDGWTRDRTLHKVKIRVQMLEPRIGSKLSMIPTAVMNVEEFYAQLNQAENIAELTELQARLNDPNTSRQFRKMDHKPYTREYVLAMFHQDGSWYRAEVIEYYHDGFIDVFYLDYGNHEQVTINDLRLWDDQFDYLPFQAVHCRLSNVSALRENDVDATVALRDAILDKVVTVTVLDIRAYWEVLVCLDEDRVNGASTDQDVGRWLVRRQFARPRKPIVMGGDKNVLVPA
ncbi:uncharacterized protein LOC129760226 isoform X2 [Uranotaenia lowii]|uniref:uncharacterized protein LOC129760226 isoform X2 n=1 Tax=Uranotaenia lowii TaxID=190385 RepID=UPI00247A8685|nr:uncharacterized protein LOC129760226 isoform X2 [Uranotaenia lowii]